MQNYSSAVKILITAAILIVLTFIAFPLAIVAGFVGVPLIVYWAYFSPDNLFPNPFKK